MPLRSLTLCWILLLCGCAAPSLTDDNADQALQSALTEGHQLSDEESKMVSDRKISFEEYKAAVTRFRECMAANGTPIGDFRYDEDVKRYDWTIQEEYFTDPVAQACERELQLTDMLWQAQVETELEPMRAREREARRVNIIECMRAKGAEVDPDLPYGQLMVRASTEFPDCVDAAFEQ